MDNRTLIVLGLLGVCAFIVFLTWLRRRHQPDNIAFHVVRNPSPVERQIMWNSLTPREKQVAILAAKGQRNADIARALNITDNTVDSHVKRIYRKLDVHNRAALATAIAPFID